MTSMKRSNKERNGSLQWFLTFPKNEATKEELLEEVKLIGDPAEYVIAAEKHKDGTPHLHAYIKWDRKVKFKELKFTKQGNYQPARSWRAVQEYCKKGGDYISNIDIDSARNKKSKQNKFLIESDPVDLIDNGDITLFQLKSYMTNKELYLSLKRQREHKEEHFETEKKRHIWLTGPSDSGKSTKLHKILEEYQNNNFQIPYNNDWAGYRGERVLWCDEYKGQLSIQDVNRMCDGGAKMNTKGGTIVLHKCPQVIIVSNYDPSGCYCKAEREIVQTLLNRFNIVNYNYKDEQE